MNEFRSISRVCLVALLVCGFIFPQGNSATSVAAMQEESCPQSDVLFLTGGGMVTITVLLRIPQLKDAKEMTTSQGLSCGNALVKARQSVKINFVMFQMCLTKMH